MFVGGGVEEEEIEKERGNGENRGLADFRIYITLAMQLCGCFYVQKQSRIVVRYLKNLQIQHLGGCKLFVSMAA